MTTLPMGCPLAERSKKTLGKAMTVLAAVSEMRADSSDDPD